MEDYNMTNSSQGVHCMDRVNGSAPGFQISTLGYVLVEIFLVVALSFGNILVLAAVLKFEELRTSTNTFVLSLTVSDLTVALVALPLHILIFLIPAIKSVFVVCMLRYCCLMVTCGTSIITLMFISVDRYIAINAPYAYPRIVTKSRSKLLCIAAWVYTVGWASTPLLGWNHWTPCVPCTFTLVLPHPLIVFILSHVIIITAVIGVLNMKIFLTANAIANDIHKQQASVSEKSSVHTAFLKNRKAAIALAMVFGAYAVCNLPFAIFTIWEVYILNTRPSYAKEIPSWFDVIRIATTFCSLINSGMNPIIYHRRIPEFRRSFRKLLGLKTEVQDYPSSSTEERTVHSQK